MAVYIKTKDGIKRVSNEDITKTDIENALGYTPSDFSGKYNDIEGAPDIQEDDTGAYYIVDTKGNIILKVDSEGLHTTDIELDGIESVKKKLESADSLTDDSDTLFVVDGKDNIVAKIDKDGIHTTNLKAKEVYLDGQKLSEKLTSLLDNILTSISEESDKEFILMDDNGNIILRVDESGLHTTNIEAENIKELEENLQDHTGNEEIHVTEEDRARWDNPPQAGLTEVSWEDIKNNPIELESEEDKDDRLVISDATGNVVAIIDRNGFNTIAYYEKGKKVINDFGSNEETASGLKKYYFIDYSSGLEFAINAYSTNTYDVSYINGLIGLPENKLLDIGTYLIFNNFTIYRVSRNDHSTYSLEGLMYPKGLSIQILKTTITVNENNIWNTASEFEVGLYLIDSSLNIYRINKKAYDTSTQKNNYTLEKYAGVVSGSGSSSGGTITVDTELSTTSENPVQNRVITEKFTELENQIGSGGNNTGYERPLYCHSVKFVSTAFTYNAEINSTCNITAYFKIYNYSSTAITWTDVKEWIQSLSTKTDKTLQFYGYLKVNYDSAMTEPDYGAYTAYQFEYRQMANSVGRPELTYTVAFLKNKTFTYVKLMDMLSDDDTYNKVYDTITEVV